MTSMWFVPIASYWPANYIRKCVGGGDETSKKRKIEKRIMTMKMTDHGNDMVVPMGWQKRWWMVMAIRWWCHCIITNHHYPHHHYYQNHHNSTRKKNYAIETIKRNQGIPLRSDSRPSLISREPCKEGPPSAVSLPRPGARSATHTRPTDLRETIFHYLFTISIPFFNKWIKE